MGEETITTDGNKGEQVWQSLEVTQNLLPLWGHYLTEERRGRIPPPDKSWWFPAPHYDEQRLEKTLAH
jgi:hypothetical protein